MPSPGGVHSLRMWLCHVLVSFRAQEPTRCSWKCRKGNCKTVEAAELRLSGPSFHSSAVTRCRRVRTAAPVFWNWLRNRARQFLLMDEISGLVGDRIEITHVSYSCYCFCVESRDRSFICISFDVLLLVSSCEHGLACSKSTRLFRISVPICYPYFCSWKPCCSCIYCYFCQSRAHLANQLKTFSNWLWERWTWKKT